MIIEKFDRKMFENEQIKIQNYLDNPQVLQDEINQVSKNDDILTTPYPDRFSYRMTYYKGFKKYPERLKNYLIAQTEPKVSERSFYPTIMDIEPNTTCTYQCTMCRVSEWGVGGRCEDMSWPAFKEFIDQNPYLCEVKLHGMGEPLLHQDYFQMVRYLSDKYIWVRTSTNGSVLHINENYKQLIDSGIGEIQMSFDGTTKEVYENIRINGNFETIIRNAAQLNEYANTKDRLYTRMWVLLQKSNRHQLLDFVRLAAKMKFRRLSFSTSLNDWGDEIWREKNGRESIETDISEEESQKLKDLGDSEGVEVTLWKQADSYELVKKICPWPFSRPYISADMRVLPCCMLAGTPSIMDFGPADDFSNVWHGSKMKKFREQHLEGNIPSCCSSCYGVYEGKQ